MNQGVLAVTFFHFRNIFFFLFYVLGGASLPTRITCTGLLGLIFTVYVTTPRDPCAGLPCKMSSFHRGPQGAGAAGP